MLPLVDENGWRHDFTAWAIRAMLRTASELEMNGIACRLSLNLTADDLRDREIVDMLAMGLDTWQMIGERFTLELTESAMMHDRAEGHETLLKLRARGFHIALDDFGTGYSSLSHLVGLPIDELKIDRSFIVAMERSEEHRRVVRTIIDLARDLNMTPLAEGVEEVAQLRHLQGMGCHCIQGFLYARPMPLAEFIAWHAAQSQEGGA